LLRNLLHVLINLQPHSFFFYIYNIFFISTTYTQYRVKSYKQTKKWIKHIQKQQLSYTNNNYHTQTTIIIHKQQLSYTNNNYHTQTTIITHKQQLSHTNKQKSCFTIQQMLHVFLYESNSDQFFNIVINKVPNFQY
jgi:hypothetical protein